MFFFLIYAWINGWVNNCEAGDLRRHRAHHDVTLMTYPDKQAVERLVHDLMYNRELQSAVFNK